MNHSQTKSIKPLLLTALLLAVTTVFADNWMSRLPADTYVSVVSIPGTHDAATGCGWREGSEEMGNSFAKTQDLDLKAQWSVGIRAFDLRPCVYEEFMNINHGIVPTSMHFEDALCLLRDSLAANPSEFVIIHLLHEDDGDQVENAYNTRLLEVLNREDLKDCFVNFKTDLMVKDVRGKMLILSRDNYSSNPIGGIMTNWTGEVNWTKQTAGLITGAKGTSGMLFMQDYSDTHNAGGIDTKTAAITKMLDYSTTHKTTSRASVRWIFNFASAYSKVIELFGYVISTSEGYRDNATHTHATILDYLSTHQAGPTGIVLMDYAGVDSSEGYEVKGAQLVQAIIDNNFKYLDEVPTAMAPLVTCPAAPAVFSPSGHALSHSQKGLNIVRQPDGSTKKIICK